MCGGEQNAFALLWFPGTGIPGIMVTTSEKGVGALICMEGVSSNDMPGYLFLSGLVVVAIIAQW